MSWRDRPYAGDFGQPELRLRFRRPGTLTTWLIIINVAVYFVSLISYRLGLDLGQYFGLSLAGLKSFRIWQPVSYMFMHDIGDPLHILFNMIGLFIFGREFERSFGRRRFAQFYAVCGVVGGLAYLGLPIASPRYEHVPLVGASGAIYGLMMAAIIFFPHIQVIFFIFPMPIRVFGLIVAAMVLVNLLSGNARNPGGELAHIAGALAALGVFAVWGMFPRLAMGSGPGVQLFGGGRSRIRPGAWARRQEKLAREQEEVDRILDKVHQTGLQSLTWRERKTLSRATKRQRERDRELDRVDRL
jgi:membrane associated rhomboid family serine protease